MALSVPAQTGNGLANLFRQARSAKVVEEPAPPPDQPTVVSLRPAGRSGIDSTGSGVAQVAAALTLCLSRLGSEDTRPAAAPAVAAANASKPNPRSGAADLLQVLDAYGVGARRLRA